MCQIANFRSTRVAGFLLAAILLAGCSSAEQRAQSYYEHGMQLLAQHEHQKAVIEFRNAIKLKKDLLPAWRGLAQIEELDHRWEALVPVLQAIVELDPKDLETRLKLARIMLSAGAPKQALKLVEGLGEADDANVKVLVLRATIAFKLKDSASAVKYAEAALQLDPANIEAPMILAADRLANGDAKGALRIIDDSPAEHANDLGVLLFKIRIFEQLNDQTRLEPTLRQLTELYPKEAAFRKQLIRFYISQHRQEDAEKELREIAKDPENSGAELDLIRFLYATKGAAAARHEVLARISAGADIFPYQMALADLDYAEGNFTDSFKQLEALANDNTSAEHQLTAKLKLAEMNLARKNIDAADTIVADILSKDRRNVSALRLRASIRLERGELEPAISDLREALNDQPHSTQLMLMLAGAYERSGSIELAEKQFADATRVSNYDPAVGLSYVAFLQRRGSAVRTEDVLADLANRNPKSMQVLSALAQIKLAREDWAGAQEVAELLRRVGGEGIADQLLGAVLSGQHKDDQSVAAFEAAVAASPSAVQPMVGLVRELIHTKQTDKAVAFLQSVLKANPANAEAHVLMGSISLANNEPDQAIKSFNTAIERQPKDNAGYRALADLYLRQHNPDAALKVIRAGLKEQPNNLALQFTLAGVLELNGDYEAAISEYENMLAEQQGSMIVANNLASLLLDHRTDKASLERAKSLAAILQKSPVPQFKDTLGWLSYRMGNIKDAVPLLEEAVAAMPNLPAIHYHLGLGYEAAGQIDKATDEFKMALTKSPSKELAERLKAELKKTATQ